MDATLNINFYPCRAWRKALRIPTHTPTTPFNLPTDPLLPVDAALQQQTTDLYGDAAYYSTNTVDPDFDISGVAEFADNMDCDGGYEDDGLDIREFDSVLEAGRFLNGYAEI